MSGTIITVLLWAGYLWFVGLAVFLVARWIAGKFRTATGLYLRRVANTARRCPKSEWPGW